LTPLAMTELRLLEHLQTGLNCPLGGRQSHEGNPSRVAGPMDIPKPSRDQVLVISNRARKLRDWDIFVPVSIQKLALLVPLDPLSHFAI